MLLLKPLHRTFMQTWLSVGLLCIRVHAYPATSAGINHQLKRLLNFSMAQVEPPDNPALLQDQPNGKELIMNPVTKLLGSTGESETGDMPGSLVPPKQTVLSEKLLDQVRLFAHEHPEACNAGPPEVEVSDQSAVTQEATGLDNQEAILDEEDPLGDLHLLSSDDGLGHNATSKLAKSKKKSKKDRKRKQPADDEETRPKKRFPNYFIAVQITNPQILRQFEKVQRSITRKEPLLKEAVTSIKKMHVTLMVMDLASHEDVENATKALAAAREKLEHFSVDPLQFAVEKMGNFHHQVVFARLQGGEALDQLHHVADVVAESMEAFGIVGTDKRSFKPHITLLKLSKARSLNKKGIKKVDPAFYAKYTDRYFGPQTMISLQLCSMLKRQQASGYYHVDHEVFFVPGDFQDPPDADVSSESEDEDVEPQSRDGKTFLVEFEKSLNWSFVPDASPT